MRLSKDDEGEGESASITTQRKMLRAYAAENHYYVYDEYVDDGISGTTFERPDFRRMIRDIENSKVNMVITKDLSRLGRDYILTGQYTEIYFPSKKVRYIAINDGYDSDSPYTDIAPFKNIINEMYARDISKKIRSSFMTHMEEGDFVSAFAPYGYMRDPVDKHHLVADEEPAEIVREIFGKAAKGILPVDISRELNRRQVPTPLEYRQKKKPSESTVDFGKRRGWTSSTITKMLHNIVYLGHMAQGKTTKISFKSGTTVKNPKEDWYVVKNTHEPLVSREVLPWQAAGAGSAPAPKKVNLKIYFQELQNVRTAAGTCPLWGPGKKALLRISHVVLINYTEQKSVQIILWIMTPSAVLYYPLSGSRFLFPDRKSMKFWNVRRNIWKNKMPKRTEKNRFLSWKGAAVNWTD